MTLLRENYDEGRMPLPSMKEAPAAPADTRARRGAAEPPAEGTRRLLAAGADAIARALSQDSAAYLAAARQKSGQ